MRRLVVILLLWFVGLGTANAQSTTWESIHEQVLFGGYPVATVMADDGAMLTLIAFECGVWGLDFSPAMTKLPAGLAGQSLRLVKGRDGRDGQYIDDLRLADGRILLRIDESLPIGSWIKDFGNANRTVDLLLGGDAGVYRATFSAKGSKAAIAAARELSCSGDVVPNNPSSDGWTRFIIYKDPFVGVASGNAALSLICYAPGKYQLSFNFPEDELDGELAASDKLSVGLADASGKTVSLRADTPGSGSGLLYFGGDVAEGDKTWGLLRFATGHFDVFLRKSGDETRYNTMSFAAKDAATALADYAEYCTRK